MLLSGNTEPQRTPRVAEEKAKTFPRVGKQGVKNFQSLEKPLRSSAYSAV
jgi:hypothetical protein